MGQLLALLRPSSEPTLPSAAAVDINKEPPITPAEKPLITNVYSLLANAPNVLNSLEQYHGCDEQIRLAISQPGPQTETAAWEAVVPCVVKLRECYEFVLQLDQLLPKMIATFCATGTSGSVDVQSNLEQNQATAKAFADIVTLAWEFDELKVGRPAIQNDFSYYRRTVSRTKTGPAGSSSSPPVSEELSGRMSLFYAYPGPFLKLIIDTLAGYVTKHPHVVDPVARALLQIAIVCHNTIKAGDTNSMSTLRTMTCCLILYDHVHTIGLFPKASEANIRIFIKTIQTYAGASTNSLLNGLKFSGKTYNAPDVPKNVKSMLEPASS